MPFRLVSWVLYFVAWYYRHRIFTTIDAPGTDSSLDGREGWVSTQQEPLAGLRLDEASSHDSDAAGFQGLDSVNDLGGGYDAFHRRRAVEACLVPDSLQTTTEPSGFGYSSFKLVQSTPELRAFLDQQVHVFSAGQFIRSAARFDALRSTVLLSDELMFLAVYEAVQRVESVNQPGPKLRPQYAQLLRDQGLEAFYQSCGQEVLVSKLMGVQVLLVYKLKRLQLATQATPAMYSEAELEAELVQDLFGITNVSHSANSTQATWRSFSVDFTCLSVNDPDICAIITETGDLQGAWQAAAAAASDANLARPIRKAFRGYGSILKSDALETYAQREAVAEEWRAHLNTAHQVCSLLPYLTWDTPHLCTKINEQASAAIAACASVDLPCNGPSLTEGVLVEVLSMRDIGRITFKGSCGWFRCHPDHPTRVLTVGVDGIGDIRPLVRYDLSQHVSVLPVEVCGDRHMRQHWDVEVASEVGRLSTAGVHVGECLDISKLVKGPSPAFWVVPRLYANGSHADGVTGSASNHPQPPAGSVDGSGSRVGALPGPGQGAVSRGLAEQLSEGYAPLGSGKNVLLNSLSEMCLNSSQLHVRTTPVRKTTSRFNLFRSTASQTAYQQWMQSLQEHGIHGMNNGSSSGETESEGGMPASFSVMEEPQMMPVSLMFVATHEYVHQRERIAAPWPHLQEQFQSLLDAQGLAAFHERCGHVVLTSQLVGVSVSIVYDLTALTEVQASDAEIEAAFGALIHGVAPGGGLGLSRKQKSIVASYALKPHCYFTGTPTMCPFVSNSTGVRVAWSAVTQAAASTQYMRPVRSAYLGYVAILGSPALADYKPRAQAILEWKELSSRTALICSLLSYLPSCVAARDQLRNGAAACESDRSPCVSPSYTAGPVADVLAHNHLGNITFTGPFEGRQALSVGLLGLEVSVRVVYRLADKLDFSPARSMCADSALLEHWDVVLTDAEGVTYSTERVERGVCLGGLPSHTSTLQVVPRGWGGLSPHPQQLPHPPGPDPPSSLTPPAIPTLHWLCTVPSALLYTVFATPVLWLTEVISVDRQHHLLDVVVFLVPSVMFGYFLAYTQSLLFWSTLGGCISTVVAYVSFGLVHEYGFLLGLPVRPYRGCFNIMDYSQQSVWISNMIGVAVAVHMLSVEHPRCTLC